MKNTIRSGCTLLILLLAVFPCGAALTILGSLGIKGVRILSAHGLAWTELKPLWVPVAWAAGGVLGYLSLIPGVDKLMEARRRLPWHELFGICVGISAAGLFSISYLLHLSSARLFRVICVAPVAMELVLLLYHIGRFAFSSPKGAVQFADSSANSNDGARSSFVFEKNGDKN